MLLFISLTSRTVVVFSASFHVLSIDTPAKLTKYDDPWEPQAKVYDYLSVSSSDCIDLAKPKLTNLAVVRAKPELSMRLKSTCRKGCVQRKSKSQLSSNSLLRLWKRLQPHPIP
jgi:hypothetical protein